MWLENYAPSPWTAIAACALAMVMCIIMYLRGHSVMVIPIAFSLGWIGMGYALGELGMSHGDSDEIVRSGITILCVDVIVCGIIWTRGRRHES